VSVRTVQLVLHYDGGAFAGWQIQPRVRTVQGELERVLADLCGQRIVAQGAGRTDAGVHARGQAVGVQVAEKWQAATLRRAVNALLPHDVWVAAAHDMRPEFHARYSATARRYAYHIGTDAAAQSPFRRRWEWHVSRPIDLAALDAAARGIVGRRQFRAFAVRGTAPEHDDHTCEVSLASWQPREQGLTFHVEANRFLHHMVRFLVGTMIDIATGRRPASDFDILLNGPSNDQTSPPAPPHGLFLESVSYPSDLYVA
jgi:tRNA pseudouridine38-40 synthase